MTAHAVKESVKTDVLDAKIAHCLQAGPRAPFAVIAGILGVSEQTIARRYRKLRAAGAVRVIGFVDPVPMGQQNWVLRLFCRPDASERIGRALGRREDVQWVAVMAGGTEVDCVLRPRTTGDRNHLLLQQLPRTVQVTGIEAATVLHVFRGSTTRDWRLGDLFLTDAQEARLAAGVPGRTGRKVALEDADEAMVRALTRDGRTTYAELRMLSPERSEAQVRRRIAELCESGLLFFDVDIDDAMFGNPVLARIQLTVAPAQLHTAGAAIGSHPAVRFAAATSGPTSMTVSAAFPGVEELYRFLHEDVGRLEGVAQAQVIPVDLTLKRAGAVLS